MVLASFPDDAHWNAKRNAVEFSAGLGSWTHPGESVIVTAR